MKPSRQSFTLIEIVIALAAFVVGAMALMGLLTATSKVNVENRKKAMISLLASRKLEEFKIKGWTKSNAIYANSGNLQTAHFMNELLAQDLEEDHELPELRCVVEMLTDNRYVEYENPLVPSTAYPANATRYATLARLGIAINLGINRIEEQTTFIGIRDGGTLDCNLTRDQFERYGNGGSICVTDDDPEIKSADAIYNFTHISVLPEGSAKTHRLEGINHYYPAKYLNTPVILDPTSPVKDGKVWFLDFVTLTPISMRNKLFNFNGIN